MNQVGINYLLGYIRRKIEMKKLLILILPYFIFGCQSSAPNENRNEWPKYVAYYGDYKIEFNFPTSKKEPIIEDFQEILPNITENGRPPLIAGQFYEYEWRPLPKLQICLDILDKSLLNLKTIPNVDELLKIYQNLGTFPYNKMYTINLGNHKWLYFNRVEKKFHYIEEEWYTIALEKDRTLSVIVRYPLNYDDEWFEDRHKIIIDFVKTIKIEKIK